MYANQQIPVQIANTIDSKWVELNSLISPMRVEAIANICRQILDGPRAARESVATSAISSLGSVMNSPCKEVFLWT